LLSVRSLWLCGCTGQEVDSPSTSRTLAAMASGLYGFPM
jgi:hypothetical protein